MLKIKHNILLVVMLLFLVVSCMPINGTSDITNMSPKQKITLMYGTYNSQYLSYMQDTGYTIDSAGKFVQTSFPVLNEDTMNILREKRKILTQVYPLIGLYGATVSRGEPISTDIEQQIFMTLDELILLIPK